MLVGEAGLGKSTQLKKLIVDRAIERLETGGFEHLSAQPLPVYVTADSLLKAKGDLASGLASAYPRYLDLGYLL